MPALSEDGEKDMHAAAVGDLIQLVSMRDRKSFILRIHPDERLETHNGVIQHADLLGQLFGSTVRSHLGADFVLLTPSTAEITRTLKRQSQIIFPKDIGLILLKLSIEPGQEVIEAGTGSGALTVALARAVGADGRVSSYDARSDMQNTARHNLDLTGLSARVKLKTRDIADGFDETDVPALFLDVPNPWDYLSQAHRALRSGAFFGALLPTTNQVILLLTGLQRHPFGMTEVLEVLLRNYKTVPARFRPTDRMVAHTGYLVFARALCPEQPPHQLANT